MPSVNDVLPTQRGPALMAKVTYKPAFWCLMQSGDELNVIAGPLPDEGDSADDAMIACFIDDGYDPDASYFMIGRDSSGQLNHIELDPDTIEWYITQANDECADDEDETGPKDLPIDINDVPDGKDPISTATEEWLKDHVIGVVDHKDLVGP